MSSSTPISAILFGPPGTSKTQLAEHIAKYLGWPLLAVNPSYFSRNGLDKIQAQADRLFDMLAASEGIVAFLDELDEMVRDRANAEMLSRFLTTAMLPKLAEINKARRIVFIVATNYIENFDAAVSRHGRFDLVLQVMPPSTNEKLRKWKGVKDRFQLLSESVKNLALVSIERLTFDEFKSIEKELAKAKNDNEFLSVLDNAGCVLKDVIPHSKETWEQACKKQICRVRIPPSSDEKQGAHLIEVPTAPADAA